jgi:Ca2+-binding RTX toxin-like protein
VFDDHFIGSMSAESFFGGAGDDTIDGMGGEDDISGGDGSDVIAGGEADDLVSGGADDDKIDGGMGFDTIDFRFAGSVTVSLQEGTSSGDGSDTLAGIEAAIGSLCCDDSLSGDAMPNVLNGLGGSDSLFGNEGDDSLLGGTGKDEGSGGPGVDECVSIESAHDCENATMRNSPGTPGGWLENSDNGPDSYTGTVVSILYVVKNAWRE